MEPHKRGVYLVVREQVRACKARTKCRPNLLGKEGPLDLAYLLSSEVELRIGLFNPHGCFGLSFHVAIVCATRQSEFGTRLASRLGVEARIVRV